ASVAHLAAVSHAAWLLLRMWCFSIFSTSRAMVAPGLHCASHSFHDTTLQGWRRQERHPRGVDGHDDSGQYGHGHPVLISSWMVRTLPSTVTLCCAPQSSTR